MADDLTLPAELKERLAAGGEAYGQQRGGGTSKEVGRGRGRRRGNGEGPVRRRRRGWEGQGGGGGEVRRG